MKKLSILLLLLLLVGCENNANEVSSVEGLIEETEQTIPESEASLYEYDVINQSTFSNKDLIYFIMIDRFYDGDAINNVHDDFSDNPEDLKSYLGGDLKGIAEKLDYIKAQGATAIWITPVVRNEPYGYHGYWTADFESVDPHFGDMKALKELVESAHEKDLKVILDYVVNHTGYQHEWLNDPDKKNWFHNKGDITDYSNRDQLENYNLAGLPDLNTENPEVKDYFYNNVLWWIKESGVDGLRLDTVKHVPVEFWNEFAYIIKQEYPNFFLLGEVYHSSPSYLASFNELGLDSITNFSIYEGLKDTFRVYGDANKLKIAINNDVKFSDRGMNAIFLDNHDVTRLVSRTSKHGEAYLKQGLTFLMTYPSIPVVYYGTEIGLEGKDDPDNRRPMNFESQNNGINLYYKQLVEFRNKTRDYTEVTILDASSDILVVSYSNGEKSYVTAFNISLKDKDINLEKAYINYFSKEKATGTITISALESIILMED